MSPVRAEGGLRTWQNLLTKPKLVYRKKDDKLNLPLMKLIGREVLLSRLKAGCE